MRAPKIAFASLPCASRNLRFITAVTSLLVLPPPLHRTPVPSSKFELITPKSRVVVHPTIFCIRMQSAGDATNSLDEAAAGTFFMKIDCTSQSVF